MSNPMAQSEPVEQRFAVPASNEAVEGAAATRQIDGTDVIEQGSFKRFHRTPCRDDEYCLWRYAKPIVLRPSGWSKFDGVSLNVRSLWYCH